MASQQDYQREARSKLETFRANLARIEAQAEREKAGAELDVDEVIRRAKGAVKEAEAQLAKLVDAGEGVWEEAMEELERVCKRAEGFIDELLGRDGKK